MKPENDNSRNDREVEEKIKELITLLGNPDETIRKKAINALADIKGADAVKCLAGYLTHKDNLVRYSVRKALNDISARGGDNADEAAAASILPDEKKRPGIKMGRILLFLFALISIQCGLVYYFYFKPVEEPAADSGHYALSIKTGQVSKKKEDYNVIRQDEKGTPVLKIKGFVSQANKIKREAVILFGAGGDSAVAVFPDAIKMDIEAGANVEIEGELLRNDNIGPVLIKCVRVKTLRK